MKKQKMKIIQIELLSMLFLVSASSAAMAATAEQPQEPDSLAHIFTGGKVSGTLRSLLFSRDFDGVTEDRTTLAIGGNLGFETAPFYGVSAGVGFKTGAGDNLSNDELYGGVLAPGDTPLDAENYAALDEYFLRYNNWDTVLTVGAQRLDTPWMNAYDIRLTPKKYRGVGLINSSIEGVELHGYYIDSWLNWDSEDWEPITSGVTGNTDEDEGALIAGVVWKPSDMVKIEGWDYYFNEMLNSVYLEAGYGHKLGEEYTLSATLKYGYMTDVGDALDGAIHTYMAGGDISLAAYGAILTTYYGTVGDESFSAPFGGQWVIDMQIENINRADEDIWALQFRYNFERLGVAGLSAYVFYGNFSTPDSGENATTDQTELDFNIQYNLDGWFKGCSIRLRYAFIDQDEDVADGEDFSDGRIYLQYKF